MPDLARIALQEQRLQFERFDATTAWTLGVRLKSAAEAHGVAVAIDIQLHGQPLFFYAMPGTTPDNVMVTVLANGDGNGGKEEQRQHCTAQQRSHRRGRLV